MFCVEDTCTLKDNTRLIGVIDRTFGDVDSHDPDPQLDYTDDIIRHPDIQEGEFRKFLRTGIPPQGTVLVSWTYNSAELIPEYKLLLLDRAYFVGDVVKKNPRSPMSGTVVGTSTRCTLLPLAEVESIGEDGHLRQQAQAIYDVPAGELRYISEYYERCMIIYDDWVGRVEDVLEEVTVRLDNGTVVVPHRADEVDTVDPSITRVNVGDRVKAKKGNLRRGKWIFGAYNPNIKPEGTVADVRPVQLTVSWLTPKLGPRGPRMPGAWSSMSGDEPPAHLELDDLESGNIIVYPQYCSAGSQATASGESIYKYEHSEVAVGDRVKFKDLAAACAKYDGTTTLHNGIPQGQVKIIPRMETLGYDMNVFLVAETRSHVTVLWQDLTTTTSPSIDLIPDPNVDDEDEVWPGEIVCTKERNPNPQFSDKSDTNSIWFFEPLAVGVVQSVRAIDRIASVRWFLEGCVAFHEDDLLPGSRTGSLLGTPEEISLYDIRSPPGLNRRRGDYVVLYPGVIDSGKFNTTGVDWLGVVIDLGLDGLLTVRLGASTPVIDVRVPAECVALAYSSDMHSVLAQGEDTISEDEEDIYSEEGTQSDYIDNDTLIDRWYEYQGQGGSLIVVREDDNGDEDWSTEDEDDSSSDDESMLDPQDATTSHSSPGSTVDVNTPGAIPKDESVPSALMEGTGDKVMSDAPSETVMEQPHQPVSNSVSSSDHPPTSFAILDCAPPSDHRFVTRLATSTPQLLRRIQKEHKILRSSLPEGIFVRTWESRLDLLRVLIIGPIDTPYEYAPFLIDLQFGPSFPSQPPEASFHSWTNGYGPVNPNLYEDGKICLSLLGTWHADERNENWNPAKSTVLQVLVSLMGLVLVKEPYYNEAGYEIRAGTEETMLPSALYTERVYFRARGFITHALTHPISGLEEELRWLYLSRKEGSPGLLQKAIEAARDIIARSEASSSEERDGLRRVSAGAVIPLRRQLEALEGLRRLEF